MQPTGVDEVWTAEDEAVYRPLRRKKLRIEARIRRDRNRKRRFSPRLQSIARGEVSRSIILHNK